jgi:hypothetical protein
VEGAEKRAKGPTLAELSQPGEDLQDRIDEEGERSAPYCAVIGADIGIPLSQRRSAERPVGMISDLDVRNDIRFVVTLWATRDAFNRGLSLLYPELGGSPKTLHEGYVVDVRSRRRSRLKSMKPGTKLLSLVALLGALSALYTYAGTIFEPADMGIVHTTVGTIDVLAGDSVRAEIRVIARTRMSSVVIDALPVALVSEAGSVPLPVDYEMLPALAPGQSTRPDLYELAATVLARGGLLTSRRSFHAPARKVRIWQELQWTDQPVPSPKCQSQCIFTGEIYSGRNYPNGLRGQVSIDDARLDLGSLTINGNSIKGSPVQGTPLSTGMWQTLPLQPFTTYTYSVFLQARDGVTKSVTWGMVKPKITFEE